MKFEVVKALHVTQTEKKHISAFLDSGMTQAKVNSKFYTVISGMRDGNSWVYQVKISTPVKNDYGQKVFDTKTITLRTSNVEK